MSCMLACSDARLLGCSGSCSGVQNAWVGARMIVCSNVGIRRCSHLEWLACSDVRMLVGSEVRVFRSSEGRTLGYSGTPCSALWVIDHSDWLLGCSSCLMLECSGARVSRSSGVWTLWYLDFRMLECSDVRMLGCFDARVLPCSAVLAQTPRCSRR